MVDYYGTPTPINQMGTVSSPEPRLLVISLWDASMISAAEKAIQNPISASTRRTTASSFALFSPNLPRNAAKSLLKSSAKSRGIQSCDPCNPPRSKRNHQKDCKDGTITEDDQKRLEEKAQKATDNAIKEIDRIASEKEKELLAV